MTRDEKGQSALHKACTLGEARLVQMIIKEMEEKFGKAGLLDILQYEDDESSTALLVAVESGSHESTKVLISHGANVNHCNEQGLYPLHLACTIGSQDSVASLIRAGARVDCLNKALQTPLHVASANNKHRVIKYLLGKGANIEARDKDSFTPLLLATHQGRTKALQILIDEGADIGAQDKEDRSSIYLAVDQNHIDCLLVLLKQPFLTELLELNDRSDNTPLHRACSKGHLEVAVALMTAGAQVDNKNEDEQTPLHLASRYGRLRLGREILERDQFSVNDEDFESQTPLHLACIYGHIKVVAALIEAKANIRARNYYLWTPLDCAAAFGWVKCAAFLIKEGSPIDPEDKNKVTPLHLAAMNGHEAVVRLLIEKGASLSKTNLAGKNALVIAINHGNRDVVSAILESCQWRNALKNEFFTTQRETPVRLLIKRFPDLAKDVFDKCITTNLHSSENHKGKSVSADSPQLKITMDYEFLDDTYSVLSEVDLDDENGGAGEENEVWDERGRLLSNAKPYDLSSNEVTRNHPLNLMVASQRTNLLGHPLCMALVRHKWNTFGRYAFYFNLFYYIAFVAVFTEYMQTSLHPYNRDHLISSSRNANQSFVDWMKRNSSKEQYELDAKVIEHCETIQKNLHVEKSGAILQSQWTVIIVASTRLLFEIFQMFMVGFCIL